jgi:RNA polymerase sigma-70 factor (ECF subfamily)
MSRPLSDYGLSAASPPRFSPHASQEKLLSAGSAAYRLPIGASANEELDFDYEAALAACARGERFALRALYQREGRRLMGVALRLVRRREVAEEVLQDAFVQIWEKAGTFDATLGSGRGWVYSVVRYRALNELRKQDGVPVMDPEDIAGMLDQQAPDHDTGPDVGALDDCMKRLDDKRQQCIALAFIDGYSHEQIADRVGAPLGTIKSWIRRGLAALKECLS